MNKIRLGHVNITDEIRNNVSIVLESGKLTEGLFTKRVAETAKNFLNANYVIPVTNGTIALELIAIYIKYYKTQKRIPTVCVPALTFPATVNAFKVHGFHIVYCDVDKDTLTMDISTLDVVKERMIDVVVPVSLLGYPPNMDEIRKKAEQYNWIVVEDFAEAFGSKYKDSFVGTLGDFGATSFYASHSLQGGEYGLVTVKNKDDYEALISIKNHGRVGNPLEFVHKYYGINAKTTELSSAVILPQLQNAKELLTQRQILSKIYHNEIINPDIKLFKYIKDVVHLGFPLQFETENKRDKFQKKLTDYGIESRKMFPTLPRLSQYFCFGDYPVSERISKTSLYIPIHQYITDNELEYILQVINKVRV